MNKLFISQNMGGGQENICSITATSSGANLVATFTFQYPVASNYVAVSIKGEGLSYTPSPVMIPQGDRAASYTFPSSNGIPTKVSITSISPAKDGTYKYIAGEPWVPSAKTNIHITTSIQGTTMLRYTSQQAVTSNLTLRFTLEAQYADGTTRTFQSLGSMSIGNLSGGNMFSVPSVVGTYLLSVTKVSVTVSPTSDNSHTYTVS